MCMDANIEGTVSMATMEQTKRYKTVGVKAVCSGVAVCARREALTSTTERKSSSTASSETPECTNGVAAALKALAMSAKYAT